MNKADLIEVLSRVLSTRKEAVSAVDTLLEAMQGALRGGDKVVLSGFGSFHVKIRKAKVGRNPRTGETVPIPPRRVVRFRMSEDLFESTTASLTATKE